MKQFITKVAVLTVFSIFYIWTTNAQAQEEEPDSIRFKKAYAALDSLMKDPFKKVETVSKPGDKRDGGKVYWIDATGTHGLIVYEKDLGIMKWEAAVEACKQLGTGWHLASKDELNKLYLSKLDILSSYFKFHTSTEGDPGYVWRQSLSSGEQSVGYKTGTASTCAVRSF